MALNIFLTLLLLSPLAVPGLFIFNDKKKWLNILHGVCVGYLLFVVGLTVVVLIGGVWFGEV